MSQTINGVPTTYVFDPAGLTRVLVETTGGQSKKYVPGLVRNGETFEQKLEIVDLLQVQVYLYRQNGEPKMNIRCRFAYEEGVPIKTICLNI